MYPKLYKIVSEGEINDLKSLMCAMGADCPADVTPQNNTMLHIAVKFKQQEIVEWIIQTQSSLISLCNSNGDTPLHLAARAGHLELTKILAIASNFDPRVGHPVRWNGGVALMMKNLEGCNPIHEALKRSHGDVAWHLLECDEVRHVLARDVNLAGESLLYLAAEAGLDKVVLKIIESGDYSIGGPDGQNPLHIAVIKGRLGVVEILLDKASNLIPQVDGFGNTMLHYASAPSYYRVPEDEDKDRPWSQEDDQIKILRCLLGAKPSLAYVPDRNGDYPHFIAVRKDFCHAVDTIVDHCPDTAELVNRKGQNALHLAVLENNWFIVYWLAWSLKFKKLINEPDNDGNTPMHLATLTNQVHIVRLLIDEGPPDLTMSNKEGLTAMDICGYTETEHPIRDILRESGAVPGRHQWQERIPIPSKIVEISQDYKSALQTLPVVTVLVATVTFAAAFTVPGGYNNDSPHEGLPVFMRNAALQAFVLSDVLAFCSSMAATLLLVYANTHSEDKFKIHYALQTCYYISGVAILATITAFVTAVYLLTSKESLWLAVSSLVLGFAVPLFLACYRWGLKKLKRYLFPKGLKRYSFE